MGALSSKIIHPEVTILSYAVKLRAQLGKAKHQNFFLKNFLSGSFPDTQNQRNGFCQGQVHTFP